MGSLRSWRVVAQSHTARRKRTEGREQREMRLNHGRCYFLGASMALPNEIRHATTIVWRSIEYPPWPIFNKL
ncbi:hypothetical protein MTR_8g072145 [Medicago truncatula]|uniref:Uncharacterized protein n=1 Tax=Medicago truncatula TaxID=3880 RepID=A0A072TT35_MEDTR|nr:hypothetical protein MTR_8g072145 [Medicago truncatula]